MPDGMKSWFKENMVLVMALIGQALIAVVYMTNLESRVATLENRGSPHLNIIDTRLTTLEKQTESQETRLSKITDIMTRELHISPVKDK
jgi:chaperonin cofactor prefoldin